MRHLRAGSGFLVILLAPRMRMATENEIGDELEPDRYSGNRRPGIVRQSAQDDVDDDPDDNAAADEID